MRPISSHKARFTAGVIARAALAAALVLPGAAYGQSPQLQLDRLDRFGENAVENVAVDIDERLLGLVGGFIKNDAAESERQLKEVISGIKGIYVRHFEYERDNMYPAAEVEALRAQLQQSGWVRFVEARSKRSGDNAQVYMSMQGREMTGLAIIVSNPREVTVVNIVGSIDPEKIRHLGGNFGLPDLEVRRDTKPAAGSKQ
jgi:hypothetical protein